MEKKNVSTNSYKKPNWDWSPAQCSLKVFENTRKSHVWQLAPSVLLTNPISIDSDPHVRVFIDTQKSLTFSPDIGWNWHKSWNLPNISIRLQIKDQVTGEQLLTPKNIYVQIFAVKKNNENERSEKLILQDVGIRGKKKMELVDGQAYFSAMKFLSTSYNNEGQNFHLLIVVYIQEIQTEKPKILTAVISPEIFVDSRKSARDYQEKKFNSFVEPFGLDQLQKQFIKRQNKNRTDLEIEIKNDSQGLYNYLTAPNIRHKFKHPIFLAIRFSSCVSIFYNQEKFQDQEESFESKKDQMILKNLQRKLLKDSQVKNSRQNINSPVSEKYFLISIKNISDTLKRKKVLQSIEVLQSQSVGIIYDQKQILSQFHKLPKEGQLSDLYKQCYEFIRQNYKCYIPSDAQSSEEESESQQSQHVPIKEQQKKSGKAKRMESENGNKYSALGKETQNPKVKCQTINTQNLKKQIVEEPKDEFLAVKNSKGYPQNSSFSLKQIKRQQKYSDHLHSINNNEHIERRKPIQNNQIQRGQKKSSFHSLRPAASGKSNNPVTNSVVNNTQNTQKDHERMAQQPTNQYQQNYQSDLAYKQMANGFNAYGGLGNLGMLNNLYGLGSLGGMNGLSGLSGGVSGFNPPNYNNKHNGMNPQNNNNSQSNNHNGMNPQNNNNSQSNNHNGMNPQNNSNNQMNQQGHNQGLGLSNFGLLEAQGMYLNNLLGQRGNQQYDRQNPNQNMENLLYNNLMMSNWMNPNNINNVNDNKPSKQSEKPRQNSEPNLMKPQTQDQQLNLYLLQQINAYKDMLGQMAYQNSMLERNMNNPHVQEQNSESNNKNPQDQQNQ